MRKLLLLIASLLLVGCSPNESEQDNIDMHNQIAEINSVLEQYSQEIYDLNQEVTDLEENNVVFTDELNYLNEENETLNSELETIYDDLEQKDFLIGEALKVGVKPFVLSDDLPKSEFTLLELLDNYDSEIDGAYAMDYGINLSWIYYEVGMEEFVSICANNDEENWDGVAQLLVSDRLMNCGSYYISYYRTWDDILSYMESEFQIYLLHLEKEEEQAFVEVILDQIDEAYSWDGN
jgi:hypothetical protein